MRGFVLRKTAETYGPRWDQAKRDYLAANPHCAMCRGEGKPEPATRLGHIEAAHGDPEFFWDEKNWQSLCEPHFKHVERWQSIVHEKSCAAWTQGPWVCNCEGVKP